MTQPSPEQHPARIAIYGSCVSRDTAEFAGKGLIAVEDYVARQSLLSAGSDASSHYPDEAQVSSAFQERMIRGDFAGDLHGHLKKVSDVDVLLWDLTDERHGVHIFDDGTLVTRSIDLVNVPEVSAAVEGTRHLPFGTDEHFEQWAGRAREFVADLRAHGLFDRTVVLQVPWASTTADGQQTPPSMGTRPEEANQAYQRYYAVLQDLGLAILDLDPETVHADPEHVWGLAPFHYSAEVYQEILRRLGEDFRIPPQV